MVRSADRAGTVVRDQVTSLIEAALGAANEIDGKAADSAEEERRNATAQARQVLKAAMAIEKELTSLHSLVGREADGLRAKVDRILRLSAREPGASRSALAGETEHEEHSPATLEFDESLGRSLAAGSPEGREVDGENTPIAGADESVPQEADPESAEDPDEDQSGDGAETDPGADPGRSEGEAAVRPELEPADGAAPESPDADDADPEVEPSLTTDARSEELAPSSDAGAGSFDEEARSRVAAKSDLELAELYKISAARASKGSSDKKDYWETLQAAAVHEAVKRPDFGQPPEGDGGGGRRAKKQRASVLKPLIAARDAARDASPGAQSG